MSAGKLYTPLNNKVVLVKPSFVPDKGPTTSSIISEGAKGIVLPEYVERNMSVQELFKSGLTVYSSSVNNVQKGDRVILSQDTVKDDIQVIWIDDREYFSVSYNRIAGKFSKV